MKIKAISLWQPWASLIAVGAKRYETRSWHTNYRGPLLICASKNRMAVNYMARDYPELVKIVVSYGFTSIKNFSFGCAVALVDLTKCTATENCFPAQMEGALPFGDFSPGRYAWKLENIRAIKLFPVKGRQGLFEVEVPISILAREI